MMAALLLLLLAPAWSSYHCPSYINLPTFNCSVAPDPPAATDVRHLRPGNIAAVMALGDSITAGFSMKNAPVEYRGLVYSTGGDKGASTIGNFIKQSYNPGVAGTATGTTVPLTKNGAGLNYAVSEAKVHNVPDQIARLTQALNTTYKHVKDEWKLLTIFIGANDICSCYSTTPEKFETELTSVLDLVQKNIPKTFVNIMTIFNISQVWTCAKSSHGICTNKIDTFKECPCLTDGNLAKMDPLGMKLNAVTTKVAAAFAAKNDPLFTVVRQPGVDELPFSSYKDCENYLSDVDCFHPSMCADESFALAIWNNMFADEKDKQHSVDPAHPPAVHCPGPEEYLR